ncbi:hypothetical protein EIP91_011887 [Steccherinum ochraceum]|uniref:Uncharacterized protein n=1 Tax=Steccherinum ochraceum TaxID=92696 RepID=A0A4R0RP13_9APHY|nr:hypothetical protein EIP91_011887 [Steccherinum ochraceum]
MAQAAGHVVEVEGSRELYLPERLFTTSPVQVQYPRSDFCIEDLPFPVPPRRFLPPSVIPSSRFRPINPMPLRTYDGSLTAQVAPALPKAINDLAQDARLHTLKRSTCLWQNFKNYTEPTTDVNTWKASLDATGPDDILSIPPAAEQAKAVVALLHWMAMQSQRDELLGTCELSVDDGVSQQLLDPLNMLLKTRYRNRVSCNLSDETLARRKFGWTTVEAAGGVADPQQVRAYPQNAFLPQWSRASSASHLFGATEAAPSERMTAQAADEQAIEAALRAKEPPKAGFPDRILMICANLFSHGPLAEYKTFWSMSDQIFEKIFYEGCAQTTTGKFHWDDAPGWHPMMAFAVRLIKQIWAQMYFFKTKWGFVTNGSKLMLFVKTGQNELTCSDLHDLTDDDVLQALLGLCFASIDCSGDSDREEPLIEYLCPKASREADWPAPPADFWNRPEEAITTATAETNLEEFDEENSLFIDTADYSHITDLGPELRPRRAPDNVLDGLEDPEDAGPQASGSGSRSNNADAHDPEASGSGLEPGDGAPSSEWDDEPEQPLPAPILAQTFAHAPVLLVPAATPVEHRRSTRLADIEKKKKEEDAKAAIIPSVQRRPRLGSPRTKKAVKTRGSAQASSSKADPKTTKQVKAKSKTKASSSKADPKGKGRAPNSDAE